MNRGLTLLGIILIAAGLLAAAPALVGTWNCSTTDRDGNPIQAVFTVKEDGGKLVGNVMVEDIVAPISDVVADGNDFRFKVTIQEQTFEVQLKVAGSTLEGTWARGDRKGTLKGTRKS
jgi:hypothetical protein